MRYTYDYDIQQRAAGWRRWRVTWKRSGDKYWTPRRKRRFRTRAAAERFLRRRETRRAHVRARTTWRRVQ